MSMKITDWRTPEGWHAERVVVGGVHVGDVIYNRVSQVWEAFPNYPYGPMTEHGDSILAMRKLREVAGR